VRLRLATQLIQSLSRLFIHAVPMGSLEIAILYTLKLIITCRRRPAYAIV
jgi:hypothetical protein